MSPSGEATGGEQQPGRAAQLVPGVPRMRLPTEQFSGGAVVLVGGGGERAPSAALDDPGRGGEEVGGGPGGVAGRGRVGERGGGHLPGGPGGSADGLLPDLGALPIVEDAAPRPR